MTQAFIRSVDKALLQRLQGCGYDTGALQIDVQQVSDQARPLSVSLRWSLVADVKKAATSTAYRSRATAEHSIEQQLAESRQVMRDRGAAHYKNRILKALGSDPAAFLRARQVTLFELPPLYSCHTCSTCSGQGSQRCRTCGGSCRVKCGSCGGKGLKQCWGCHGSGRSGNVSCSYCGGSGGDNCSSCNGGQVTCSGCHNGQVICAGCSGDKVLCTSYTLEVSAKVVDSAVQVQTDQAWLAPYAQEWGKFPEYVERAAEGFGAPFYAEQTPERGDLMLYMNGTCYFSQAQVRAAGRTLTCNMLGRYRHVVSDDGLAAGYFDAVLEQLKNPADIDRIAQACERPVAKRLIEESAGARYVSQLSDVKNRTVSPEQANRFFELRKAASDQQTALRSQFDWPLVLRRAVSYFWRLNLLMLVLFFFAARKLGEVQFGGPHLLLTGDGRAAVWDALLSYLALPLHSPFNGVLLASLGLLCTFLFKGMLWEGMNRFMQKGPGSRLLAAIVLGLGLCPLLALFPQAPIAILQNGPRLYYMFENALIGALGALPTMVALSVLLAVVFNRALNAPAIEARLRKMKFDV